MPLLSTKQLFVSVFYPYLKLPLLFGNPPLYVWFIRVLLQHYFIDRSYKLDSHLLKFVLERAGRKVSKRTKIPLSKNEEANLLKVCSINRIGKWSKILKRFDFQPKRINTSLKDKFQTVVR